MATDPWQPFGTVLYHMVMFLVKTTGYQPLHGGLTMPHLYIDEPEPEYRYCVQCGEHTIWEPYRWVLDADTTYECVVCGNTE